MPGPGTQVSFSIPNRSGQAKKDLTCKPVKVKNFPHVSQLQL
jgi:hypothetical protein